MNEKQSFIGRLKEKLFGKSPAYISPRLLAQQQASVAQAPQPAWQPMTPNEHIRAGILENESNIVSGNRYAYQKPSGDPKQGMAMGGFQVTEGELKTYAPRYLGRPVAPKEFLGNKALQEQYMQNKVQRFMNEGYTPEQIADIHRNGFTNSGDPGSKKYMSQIYVNRFLEHYNATNTPPTGR